MSQSILLVDVRQRESPAISVYGQETSLGLSLCNRVIHAVIVLLALNWSVLKLFLNSNDFDIERSLLLDVTLLTESFISISHRVDLIDRSVSPQLACQVSFVSYIICLYILVSLHFFMHFLNEVGQLLHNELFNRVCLSQEAVVHSL